MPTKNKLADALKEANAPAFMVVNALCGQYDDFESASATPIIDLVADCRQAGLNEFAKRVINGEFDGTKEEAEEWYEKEGHAIVKNMSTRQKE